MSMSIDYRKIEQVTQFMGFVEALSNPEALKAMLDDLKAVAADVKEKVGIYDSLESVQALETEIAEKYRKMVDGFNEEATKRAEELAKGEADLRLRQNQAASIQAVRDADAKAVREAQAALSVREEKVAMAEQVNKETWALLEARAKDLAELEEKLTAKTEQLKKLLGE